MPCTSVFGQWLNNTFLCALFSDELPGFEEAWQGSAAKYFPGWNERFNGQDTIGKHGSAFLVAFFSGLY